MTKVSNRLPEGGNPDRGPAGERGIRRDRVGLSAGAVGPWEKISRTVAFPEMGKAERCCGFIGAVYEVMTEMS